MCGIAGILNLNYSKCPKEILESMSNSLYHRGPDSGGIFIHENVGLAHRRLSILDLSELGHQPMISEDGNTILVYNGEIYNYESLKKELELLGYHHRSTSDTEVLLNGYLAWGDKVFPRLNGMFAAAIYNKKEEQLLLIRGRFGIKPLYFYKDNEKLIFASEPKAILVHPNIDNSIDYQGLIEYIWFGNPLGNRSAYQHIEEVPPGTILKIKKNGEIKSHEYFSPQSILEEKICENEAVEQLRVLTENAVKSQLVSDVPVGVFLSGGIDSSAITAYASRNYRQKLHTYTAAFDFMPSSNEYGYARKISEICGTEHSELFIKGKDLPSIIESLVSFHGMPFGDAADIPLYLLSQELKGNIKVILQGDGGDELFGGYNRHRLQSKTKYRMLFKLLLKLASLVDTQNPKLLKFNRVINALSQRSFCRANALLLTIESDNFDPTKIFNSRVRQILTDFDPFQRYKEVYSLYASNKSNLKKIFLTDLHIILKDTFLEKVDRATMSGSIESRVPFLDNDLVNFALSIPAELHVKGGVSKYLFKKSLRGVLPDEILGAPKRGFGVPYGEWLKNSLKDYFKYTINGEEISKIINKKEVERLFSIHSEGKGNYGFLLWKTMVLGSWLQQAKPAINFHPALPQKKQKILCVIDSLGSGGAQRQLVILAQGLKIKGYDVDFFTYHESSFFKQILVDNDIKIYECPKNSAYSISPIKKLRQLLIDNNYHYVISYLDVPNFYVELASVGIRNLKVIVSERSQVYNLKHLLRKLLLSFTHFFSSYIVCNSFSHAEWMKSYLPWLKKKIVVINNGLDVRKFKPGNYSGREGVPSVKLVGLGRITEAKNLLTLAKSFVICRKKYNLNLHIDWFGRIDSQEIFKSINDYLIKESVGEYWKWGGEVSKPEEVLVLGYDALICASLWEGFPNAIYEGMASGLPILASNISDIPKIIEEGRCGYLFDPNCAEEIARSILNFYKLPIEDKIRLSNNAVNYSKRNVSIDSLVSNYERLF